MTGWNFSTGYYKKEFQLELDFSSSDVTGSQSDHWVSPLTWLCRSMSSSSVVLASIAGTQARQADTKK